MQNNHERSEHGAVRKFFQEKGYYIVLFLCIAAVGISGYVFVAGAISEKKSLEEESLSVATEALIPDREEKETGTPAKPADQEEKTSVPVSSDTNPEESVRQTAASVRVWPVSGSTLMDYSMDKLTYHATTRDWRTHDGMDLAAMTGEPVKAACAGTVTAVFDDEFFGTTVVLTHPDGYTTRYSNLEAMPTVKIGDRLDAGEILGAVGHTALLESGEDPHLHFSVYLSNEPVDPMTYLN